MQEAAPSQAPFNFPIMTILILSGTLDLHAHCVRWMLRQNGIAAEILDLTDLPCNGRLSLRPTAPLNQIINQILSMGQGQHAAVPMQLDAMRAVWVRRTGLAPKFFDYSAVHEDDLQNVQQEMVLFTPGVWHLLQLALGPEVAWLNPFHATVAAKNKAVQLRLADAVGFATPATLIGNDPDAIRQFCLEQGGSIIVKPFQPKQWRSADGAVRVLPTTVIQSSDLQNDAALQLCPAIYQSHVQKEFELRVLVLGDELIAVKLDSQAHQHSKVDWRMDSHARLIQAEPYALSAGDSRRIHDLMRALGLRMGSIDFIMDQQGQLVFLEVNEQGQFLFLEELCPQLPILAAVCRFLLREGGCEDQCTAGEHWPSFADYRKSADYADLARRVEGA